MIGSRFARTAHRTGFVQWLTIADRHRSLPEETHYCVREFELIARRLAKRSRTTLSHGIFGSAGRGRHTGRGPATAAGYPASRPRCLGLVSTAREVLDQGGVCGRMPGHAPGGDSRIRCPRPIGPGGGIGDRTRDPGLPRIGPIVDQPQFHRADRPSADSGGNRRRHRRGRTRPIATAATNAAAAHPRTIGHRGRRPPRSGGSAPRSDRNENPGRRTGDRDSLKVELGRIELPTFSMRTRRATNCAIAPCGSVNRAVPL